MEFQNFEENCGVEFVKTIKYEDVFFQSQKLVSSPVRITTVLV